jgi:hypothetical protein
VSDVATRPVGTLGTTTAFALDGNEVTGAPPVGYGLGNAVTVMEFVVVVITLFV